MRLIELDPEWVYDYAPSGAMRRAADSHQVVHAPTGAEDEFLEYPEPGLPQLSIGNAQGVLFLCPVCFKKNGGAAGTESVLCWFKGRGVPDSATPGPGRWDASGASFEDLTLSPSVNVDHEHWHGWIKNGEVT